MWDSKFVMYIMDNSRAVNETFNTLDLWCMWSLTELQLGSFLDVNPFGQQHHLYDKGRCGTIAGGWRGIVVYHKGDEKYIQRAYRASHSAVSKNVCLQCLATSSDGDLVYTHHGLNAAHRATKMSTEVFIEKVVGVRTWVALPGWDISMLAHDWLHVVDLSLVPEAAASALVELVDIAYFGAAGTSDERLRLAFTQFTKACKQAGVRNRGKMFSMILGYIFLCACCFLLKCFVWLVGWLVWVQFGLGCVVLCFLWRCTYLWWFLESKETSISGWSKVIPYFGSEAFQRSSISMWNLDNCCVCWSVIPHKCCDIFSMFKHNAQNERKQWYLRSGLKASQWRLQGKIHRMNMPSCLVFCSNQKQTPLICDILHECVGFLFLINPSKNTLLRLRAAVFVNLVRMRRAMSSSKGNGLVSLSPHNLTCLQRANYLFHSAHNWCLEVKFDFCNGVCVWYVFGISGNHYSHYTLVQTCVF